VIAGRLAQIGAAVDEVQAFLARGPATAYEVAVAVRSRRIFSRTETTLSHVLGQLRLLLDAGAVSLDDGEDGVLRFRGT
jgi:hypothetical protein